jgi:DNA-binding transcriptional MerR regulator
MKTHQVARISGLTLRQLQWWDEHRIVSPERIPSKHPRPDRDYNYQEAALCCIAAVLLLEKGWTLKRIRPVLDTVRDATLIGWLVVQSDFRFRAVTAFLAQDPAEVIRVIAEHGGFCSVVDLGACLRLLKMETETA